MECSERKKKLIAALVIGFGLFHCTSLLLALLPSEWTLNSLMDPYRKVTGTQQQWNMFETIPIAQDQKVTIEVKDAAGETRSFGPILPGLSEFDLEARIRFYPLLHQLRLRDGIYLGSYLEKLEAAVVAEVGEGAREFSIRAETDRIRLIKKVDEDGKMTVSEIDEIGPIPIGAR